MNYNDTVTVTITNEQRHAILSALDLAAYDMSRSYAKAETDGLTVTAERIKANLQVITDAAVLLRFHYAP